MPVRLTAEELGVLPEHYDALVWTRNALDPSIPDTNLPDWLIFDMATWCDIPTRDEIDDLYQMDPSAVPPRVRETYCGTAACIGGTMALYLSGGLGNDMDPSGPLNTDLVRSLGHPGLFGEAAQVGRPFWNLFYNWRMSGSLDRGRAVAAIDEFFSGNTSDPWLTTQGPYLEEP